MPNYNIQVVVDPSSATPGINVVESGLDKVTKKAQTTKAAVQGAFDFSTTDAVNGVNAVDRSLDQTAASATAAGRATESAITKAAAAAARANGTLVNSQAQVRASTLQLGQQFNDFSTQVLAGGSVVTAFAQQSGQAAFALQGMNGWLGTVGRFLAGPWGTIGIIATTVLAGFVTKLIQQNDELDEAVKKLREDAREAEIANKAKEAFSKTTEGLTKAIRDMNEELGKSITSTREQEKATLDAAQANLARTLALRQELQAMVQLREQEAKAQLDRAMAPNQQGEMAALGLVEANRRLSDARADLAKNTTLVAEAEAAVRNAMVPVAIRDAEELSTATGRINRQYDQMRDSAIAAARGNDQLARSLTATLTVIEQQRQAALKAERDRESASSRSDGVPRFTTRQQAIGLAGRELQTDGLRVSENEQFGGVRARHQMAGHGQFAIDVNYGTGVVEANVPHLKDRFDRLARMYQARGYRVIWNGQVYPAGGDGPSGSAQGHQDHLHIEAPQTIVGRPTQGSQSSAQLAELRRIATEAEQQADYLDSIVDRSAQRGRRGSVADAAAAELERVEADFQRRFNRAMTDAERTVVEGAINAAVARETAAYFNEAYNEPLRRLEALQGTTGVSRQVLNAQIAETVRLGRELTPLEREQVELGIRQGDQLQREAQLLADIRAPLEDYAAQLAALNALLERGDINQTSYNARIADLGRTARDALTDMPGVDPLSGQSYTDIAARADEDARYARELELYQDNRAQLLALGISYDALEQAARRRHIDNLNAIDQTRRQVAIQSAQSTAESLADIARLSLGEQSAVYKAMFVASKAFAIADSIIKIQQGVANALALPFPANLSAVAAVAAQAASIVSNIQAITLNLAGGGLVRGPGTSTSDSVPANLSNGEYVVRAAAVKKNLPFLEAINSGRASTVSGSTVSGLASGGVQLKVSVHNLAPGVEHEVRSISATEVEVIARRIVQTETPKVVAGQMEDPNSRVSKALSKNTTAGRRRLGA